MSYSNNTGNLFVISAPSGAGKSTLLKKVMSDLPRLIFSVSHTTRTPRPGEKDGIDYHYISHDQFNSMIENDLFLEYARVHDSLYGTSSCTIEEQLSKGNDVILEIDVQGAAIIRASKDNPATHIFIAPPNLAELERRLRKRGTETEENIQIRLANAKSEMAAAKQYEYLLVNEDFDATASLLHSIIIAERARNHRHPSGEPIEGLVGQ